jgi:hypothetical protein
MNTTVAFGSGYSSSSGRTIPFVVQPAVKKAQEPELVVTHLPPAKAGRAVTGVRIDVPKSAIWNRLELGAVVVLALSVFVSVLLFLAAIVNT